jgi:hypothetical protein
VGLGSGVGLGDRGHLRRVQETLTLIEFLKSWNGQVVKN